jgi:hypothetical protein
MPRTDRSRHDDLYDLVDRLDDQTPEGSPAMLVATGQGEDYPPQNGNPQVFYLCNPAFINNAEVEGTAVQYTTDGDHTLYCLNIGTTWPPPNTVVVAHLVGDRWCFAYFG